MFFIFGQFFLLPHEILLGDKVIKISARSWQMPIFAQRELL